MRAYADKTPVPSSCTFIVNFIVIAVLCRVTQSSSPSRVPSQMCASPKSSRVFLLMDQVESKSELLLSRVESSRVKVVLSIGLWAIL